LQMHPPHRDVEAKSNDDTGVEANDVAVFCPPSQASQSRARLVRRQVGAFVNESCVRAGARFVD
jgi:hypothetical protein